MTSLAWLALGGLVGALFTLGMTIRNLGVFQPPPADAKDHRDTLVSVCVPARNEADNIERCVRAILESDHQRVEVLIYDDESTDETPRIVERLSRTDDRIRVVPSRPLPAGWSGKQFACDTLGRAASGRWLLFTDADVELDPSAIGRSLAYASENRLDLVSAFPRQIVRTPGEVLQVPMMFFLLLSYLPFGRMRTTNDPAASAGCGQFLLVRTDAYLESGGHAAFRDSMHDGIKMPRTLRRAGFRTDVVDGTPLATVRMYAGVVEAWQGFAKNAYEGLGSVPLLVFLTVYHLVSHVAPWVILPIALATGSALPAGLAAIAVLAGGAQRIALARRFKHPPSLALVHPITVLMMIGVQWHSLWLHTRRSRSWRGRTLIAADPGAAS